MSDETTANQIDGAGQGRSRTKGDVPEDLRRRYYLDGRGGLALGFYVDARIQTPAFRDLGGRLTATRTDPNVVRDLVRIAQHRGWAGVTVRGELDFRRETWLAASAANIAVAGYRPSARDQQELERRIAGMARRGERHNAAKERPGPARPDPAATMRTVETVVRARVAGAGAQERILQAARLRIAGWLERDAGMNLSERANRPRERQRSR
jgi:hypothetical protein